MTLIFFTRSLPNAISDELSRQGHVVHEALAISEVLALAEQHPEAQIVIAGDIETRAANVIQQHHTTLTLKPNATTKELIWELSVMDHPNKIQ